MAGIIGIEIRKDKVAALVVRKKLSKYLASESFSSPIKSKKGHFNDFEDYVLDSLKELLNAIGSKYKISSFECYLALPPEKASFKNISIPFQGKKKIAQVLPIELEQNLIHPVSASSYDFNILKGSKLSKDSNILVCAYERKRIQEYLGLLKSFKLKVKIITIGVYPIVANTLLAPQKSENGIFVDIGSTSTFLAFIANNEICLIRSFLPSGSSEKKINSLCLNIKRTLSAFNEKFDISLEEKFILNADVRIPKDILKQKMQNSFPQYKIDFLNFNIAKSFISIKKDIPIEGNESLISLCNLKNKNLNFMHFKEELFSRTKIIKENKKNIIRTSILAACVLAINIYSFSYTYYQQKAKVDQMEMQIKRIFKEATPNITRIVNPVYQLEGEIKKLDKAKDAGKDFGPKFLAIEFLDILSKSVPGNVNIELNKIIVNVNNVTITGAIDNFNSINMFKSNLEQIREFKTITITSAVSNPKIKMVQFQLNIAI